MRKLGFWNSSERHQIEAINEASSMLGNLQENAGELRRQVGALHGMVRAQQHDIAGLRAALQAVCDMLVDLGHVEEAALEQRVAAAIEDPGPSAVLPAPAKPTPKRIRTGMQCSRCKGTFAAREITFAEGGPTCARCIAASGG